MILNHSINSGYDLWTRYPNMVSYGYLGISTCQIWSGLTKQPKTHKFKEMYELFLEKLINFNLEQMVKIATRNQNVLDLFFTNMLSAVHVVQTLPSLVNSDHNFDFPEIQIKRGRSLQPKRNLLCCRHTNWTQIKDELNEFS